MFSGKKITREDTWKPDDLIKHIQNQEEDSRRTERDRRKHREQSGRRGETRDEREKDWDETEYRKRERYKEKERDKGGLTERDLERERRNREKEREGEKRDREKERETRDREKDIVRERRDRDKERETRDREKEREREKGDRDKDGVREKRDREKEREREKRDKDGVREKRDKDGVREKRNREKERETRDREKEGVRERRDREKEGVGERRNREKERETRDREKEGVGERRDREKERKTREREKDRVRERREKESETRDREKERERHRAKEGGQDRGEERDKEKERERRMDERRREKGEKEERRGAGERGEETNRERKERHRQDTGQTDREERQERMRREDGVREQRHRTQDEERDEGNDQVEQDVVEDVPGAAEDYGNEGYKDDFEEYEEDFEECDEEDEDKEEEVDERIERELSPHSRRELEEVRRAMEKENEMVIAGQSRSSTQESEIFHRASSDTRKSRAYGRVIDFTSARQRERNQQAAQKHKKRSIELLRLIDLDFSVTECLLDLPPVRDYDAYIKSYGTANTKQAYVQCNEDNAERDTQTEDTDVMDKWTQHPPESSVACGGDGHDVSTRIPSDTSVTKTTFDSKRLVGFLRSSAQVMAVLLEENVAENNSVKKLQSQTHTHSFSDGYVQLNTSLSLLQDRQVKLLHFSQKQPHTLLSVHSPHSSSTHITHDRTTLICVWNIWEPSTPRRILIYETEVRSCCFSPGKAVLVFAGTDVGSVLLWDLREPSSSHSSVRVCEEEWTLRYPTFSTDAVLSGAGHLSAVVSVEPVMANVGAGLRDPLLPDQEESLGMSFQLGSLDENGLLNLWVVVELPRGDDCGSETDLGLRPGGKVKLLHSSSLQTTPQVDMGVTSHLSSVLRFLPSDSNHYIIGSNMGLVRHGTRHGLRAVPKLYRPKDGDTPANVTALEFCPNGEPYFLVGCSDGVVRLHACVCEEAVCEWSVCSGCVRCVSFSPTRCSVFCALDSASVLHIWDLTQRDESPVLTHDLHTDPVSAMVVFGDAARQNPYSGVALGKRSGSLEIHFLLPSLTLPQSSDTKKLHSLANDTL